MALLCFILQFAIMLAVIFIMMIAGGIAAYVLRNEVSFGVSAITILHWHNIGREFIIQLI